MVNLFSCFSCRKTKRSRLGNYENKEKFPRKRYSTLKSERSSSIITRGYSWQTLFDPPITHEDKISMNAKISEKDSFSQTSSKTNGIQSEKKSASFVSIKSSMWNDTEKLIDYIASTVPTLRTSKSNESLERSPYDDDDFRISKSLSSLSTTSSEKSCY
jgi:hypothetical protein